MVTHKSTFDMALEMLAHKVLGFRFAREKNVRKNYQHILARKIRRRHSVMSVYRGLSSFELTCVPVISFRFVFVYRFFWRIQFTSDWSLFFMLDFFVWILEVRMWICCKWKIALAIKNVPNEVSSTVSFALFIRFQEKLHAKKAVYIHTYTCNNNMNIQSLLWRVIGAYCLQNTTESFAFFVVVTIESLCVFAIPLRWLSERGMIFFYFDFISSRNNEVNENRKG